MVEVGSVQKVSNASLNVLSVLPLVAMGIDAKAYLPVTLITGYGATLRFVPSQALLGS